MPPYNRKFTGWLDELLLLRKRLQDDRAGVISGVHGLGGIGTTELAFTFAHAFAGEYPGGQFLIPCERHDSLRRAVLHLGDRFRDQISDEQRMTAESYFSAFAVCLQRRLATHGRILLVLDTVTDRRLLRATETDTLTALGPLLHLLATTREATGKSGGIQWLTVGELSESESVELLEKHRDFANADERLAAQRIARRLGGFSLAVELVAAWLAEHPEASCETCLQRLGLEDLETLDDLTNDPPIVAARLNNLAALLQSANRLAEAEPLMRRAVEISQRSLGAEHPNAIRMSNNHRRLREEMNRLVDESERPDKPNSSCF